MDKSAVVRKGHDVQDMTAMPILVNREGAVNA